MNCPKCCGKGYTYQRAAAVKCPVCDYVNRQDRSEADYVAMMEKAADRRRESLKWLATR